MVYLKDPVSGVVQTYEEWRSTFSLLPAELWGGDRFEDADLVPVEERGVE